MQTINGVDYNEWFLKSSLLGTTATSLEQISGTVLGTGDMAFVQEGGMFYALRYNAAGSAATSSPSVIRPYDFSITGGNWENSMSPFGTQKPNTSIIGPYGGIYAGDVTKTGANQVTVGIFSCLDTSEGVQLYTSTTVPVATLSGANTITHLGMVRLISDGSTTVLPYISEAAMLADVGVTTSACRYRGWWPNTAAGAAAEGWLIDDILELDIQDAIAVSVNPSTTPFVPTYEAYFPSSRVQRVGLSGKTGSGGTPEFDFYLVDSSGNGGRSWSTANAGAYGPTNFNGSSLLWINCLQKIRGRASYNTGAILASAFKLLI